MINVHAYLTFECHNQHTWIWKAYANKIVPDQTAPKEQSDQGLFACFP